MPPEPPIPIRLFVPTTLTLLLPPISLAASA
jgi:hypothetical protein